VDSELKALESERMSKKHGNRYSTEFKQEAVRLLLTSGKTAQQLARELGVTGVSLANWREEAIRNGDHPEQAKLDSVRVHYSVLRLENERLKKELQVVRQEREILKKSLGILPRAQSRKGMP
jgi:transposase